MCGVVLFACLVWFSCISVSLCGTAGCFRDDKD